MKAYISDPEDLKQDSTYQETWDDMIINVSILFLFEDYNLFHKATKIMVIMVAVGKFLLTNRVKYMLVK